jgi:hypothetical protein
MVQPVFGKALPGGAPHPAQADLDRESCEHRRLVPRSEVQVAGFTSSLDCASGLRWLVRIASTQLGQGRDAPPRLCSRAVWQLLRSTNAYANRPEQEASMPQVFSRGAGTFVRACFVLVPLSGALVMWCSLMYTRSSYGTGSSMSRMQTVPFSHEHHVGVLGIDCRYCHTSVETSSYAGIPTTKTCMNCHSQIWVGSEMLAPVRESYRTNQSLRWQRVYNLPGFVYFDHSIHVHKGIGCTTCHGQIDEQPLTMQAPSLLMEWCLKCHRNPERNLRPQSEIFNVRWQRPPDQDERGRELARQYKLRDTHFLTSCTVCHR